MKLQQSFTPLELALITEIHSKKNYLRIMDENDIYSNTKLEVEELKERHFVVYDDWYIILKLISTFLLFLFFNDE